VALQERDFILYLNPTVPLPPTYLYGSLPQDDPSIVFITRLVY